MKKIQKFCPLNPVMSWSLKPTMFRIKYPKLAKTDIVLSFEVNHVKMIKTRQLSTELAGKRTKQLTY